MINNKPIKILFTDFWHPATVEEINKNPIYRLLSKKFNIELSDKPDVLIYSRFGFQHLNYNCLRIFYTGENVRPNFSRCDYAFSFDYPNSERNFRWPLYRLYDDYKDLFIPRDARKIINEKRKFCCFINSNPNAKERIKLFDMLSGYKQVDSGGKVRNNIGYRVDDKMEFLRGYKFNIAFENSQYPGYTTEKLMHALAANTIPIYWGNPLAARDFNPGTFINCHDYKSFAEVIEVVKKIDGNENLYKKYLEQPFFPNGKEFVSEEQILERFGQILSSRKVHVSHCAKSKQRYLYKVKKGKKTFKRELKSLFSANS